ncbi:MAG: carbohydrate ABC transporter permease [Candidatus Gastranaerophilaceae bacterium]
MNKRKIYLFFGYLVLILIAFSMLFPFVAMLNIALSNENEIFNSMDKFFHLNITFDNFLHVFKEIPITRYFYNSLLVALVTTVGQVVISALAGYSFARLNFKYKEILFLIILITMMVPPQVNIVPLFFLMRELHLVNTFSALILPGLFGGFGVFFMRQYFLSLPKDLEDAARIDGCNLFQTFFKVALPLALPAVVTLFVFTFVMTWNSFIWPLIVTNTENMRTLPVGLAIYKGSFREITMWGDLMACSVVCIIPVIVIFLLGKRYFLSDLLSGSVKE